MDGDLKTEESKNPPPLQNEKVPEVDGDLKNEEAKNTPLPENEKVPEVDGDFKTEESNAYPTVPKSSRIGWRPQN